MNLSYKERQIVLFPEATDTLDESKRPDYMAARLTLSIESLVILAIVSIMVILFAFSIGMERGKRVVLSAPDGSGTIVRQETSKPWADLFHRSAPVPRTDVKAAADELKSTNVKAAPPKVQDVSPVKGATSVVASDVKAPGGGYTVQVASYKTQKSAQRELDSLKAKGFHEVYVLPKGQYIILCVGNFKNRSEADVFGKKNLKSRYQDFRVRSL